MVPASKKLGNLLQLRIIGMEHGENGLHLNRRGFKAIERTDKEDQC